MTNQHRDITMKRESTVWQAVRAVQVQFISAGASNYLFDDPGPCDG